MPGGKKIIDDKNTFSLGQIFGRDNQLDRTPFCVGWCQGEKDLGWETGDGETLCDAGDPDDDNDTVLDGDDNASFNAYSCLDTDLMALMI